MRLERIEIEAVDSDKLAKIIQKLQSIGMNKLYNGQPKQVMLVSEFKHLVCAYRIEKGRWHYLAKQLETMGVVRYHRNHFLEIRLPSEALEAYSLSKAQNSSTSESHQKKKEDSRHTRRGPPGL